MTYDKRFKQVVAAVLLLWLFFFFYFMHSHSHVSTIIVILLDIGIAAASWFLSRSELFVGHGLYLYIFISFASITIGNFLYWFIFGFCGINSASSFQSTLFMLPYFIFLLSQLFFWVKLIRRSRMLAHAGLYSLLPFLLVSALVLFMFVYASLVEVKHFGYVLICEMTLGVFDLIMLNIVTLVLICAKNKGIYFIGLAIAMIVTTNFWWMYLFHNHALGVADYSAFFWFLATLLMIFGLSYIRRVGGNDYSDFIGSVTEIKSQASLWTFSLSIFSVIILSLLGYAFNLISVKSIESLPFLIMIFSLILIILSSYMGNIFDRPFKLIQQRIENLVTDSSQNHNAKVNYYISEFTLLEKFFVNTFTDYKAGVEERKNMVDMALQMAHDIRSPVSTLLMLAKDCHELPGQTRTIMRNAAGRVEDISNYLLKRYEQKDAFVDEERPLLVSAEIRATLSEKRIQYKHAEIQFLSDIPDVMNFLHIRVNHVEFKRMLSNLINNSVEAISGAGVVTVKLTQIDLKVSIEVIDDGAGMTVEQQALLFDNARLDSSKVNGYGLGLSHAVHLLNQIGASIKVDSQLGVGTRFTLEFDSATLPEWITDRIDFYADDTIVILDDDNTIHGAWNAIFNKYVKEFPGLVIKNFVDAEDCIDFVRQQDDLSKVLLLTDYELLNKDLNGLKVLEVVAVTRKMLVTSYYEKQAIIKRSILLNTKILPKTLASHARLTVRDKEVSDNTLAASQCDLIVLEDNREYSDILRYLCAQNGRKTIVYNSVYELLSHLKTFDRSIKICLDYDLGCPVNGIDIAELLYNDGYENLYMASGFSFEKSEVPPYINLIKKNEVFNL
jgi:signal transduction histidine kinase